jgi:hypothetical protein
MSSLSIFDHLCKKRNLSRQVLLSKYKKSLKKKHPVMGKNEARNKKSLMGAAKVGGI